MGRNMLLTSTESLSRQLYALSAAGQLPISPDCVFDASLVPGTCLHRFVDLKGFTQQVPVESRVYQEPSTMIIG
jgi:hypothetical protein